MPLFSQISALVVFLVFVVGSSISFAQDYEYEIFSNGKRLGTIIESSQEVSLFGQEATEITVVTKLRAKALFITVFSLDSDEIVLFDDLGLLSYESQTTIDDQKISINGKRENGQFVFETESDCGVQTIAIAMDDFEFTSANEPLAKLSSIGQPLQFRILDLDRIEVIDRKFIWIRDETIEVKDNPVHCFVIDVSDPFGNSRRWLTKDGLFTLVKEEGVDDGDPFRVFLIHSPTTKEDSN